MPRLVLTVDGDDVYDFAGFIQQFNSSFSRFGVAWDGNLDAFKDYLVWPDEPYDLVWVRSDLSRRRLGHGEMAKWLEANLRECHPAGVPGVRHRLAAAQRAEGQTLFELLVEIIEGNKHYVTLRLE